MDILRIFIGFDKRQPLAAQVLMHSIYRRTKRPVCVTPLVLETLPLRRTGLTDFTYSRYLVPYLCGYRGTAVFLDADMLCLGDVDELVEHANAQIAGVCVVKNPRLRFEWPSVMVFRNAMCTKLTPALVEEGKPQSLDWTKEVGELPAEWNHLVGYDQPRKDAKLVHFTQGIPCWKETRACEYAKEWGDEWRAANATVSWEALMGNSVHAAHVKREPAVQVAA